MIRRFLLAALLVYVALDLSLPEMPGAFVFDAADSVDGINGGRARPTDKIALPIPRADAFLPSRLVPRVGSDRPRPRNQIARPPRSVKTCLTRAACASVFPSEDPH